MRVERERERESNNEGKSPWKWQRSNMERGQYQTCLNLHTVSPHRWKSIEWLSNNSIEPQQVINDIIG